MYIEKSAGRYLVKYKRNSQGEFEVEVFGENFSVFSKKNVSIDDIEKLIAYFSKLS